MSKEYPCVYYKSDGLCRCGGDESEANVCVLGPCTYETPSNADLIRAMSDEELAATLPCPNEMGMADISCDRTDNCNCCQCRLDWLKQPAGEGKRHD